MFWTLCITVCLAIFLIVTTVGTVVANIAAGLIENRKAALRFPGALFALRVLPVAAGLAITFGFVFPSFLWLEPKQTIERPEPGLLLLAACAFVVLSVFAVRAINLALTTKDIVREWQRIAEPLPVEGISVPVYIIGKPESLIAVAGFFNPKIFIGRQAFASMTEDELSAAIAHESAHVRSLDNLKQLFLHATRFPKCLPHLACLEASWSQASEFAADQKALNSGVSPLDLASALVTIGRLKAMPSAISDMVVSHFVAPGCSSAIAIRVQRLQSLLTGVGSSGSVRPQKGIPSPVLGLLLAGGYLTILPAALPVTHRMIEWLVR